MSVSEAEGHVAELFATGQVEASYGTPLGGIVGSRVGGSLTTGARGTSSRSGDARASVNYGKANDILSTYARTNNLNEQRENFDRAVHNTSDSSITSKADTVSASYTRAASVSQEARDFLRPIAAVRESRHHYATAAVCRLPRMPVSASSTMSSPSRASCQQWVSRRRGIRPAGRRSLPNRLTSRGSMSVSSLRPRTPGSRAASSQALSSRHRQELCDRLAIPSQRSTRWGKQSLGPCVAGAFLLQQAA